MRGKREVVQVVPTLLVLTVTMSSVAAPIFHRRWRDRSEQHCAATTGRDNGALISLSSLGSHSPIRRGSLAFNSVNREFAVLMLLCHGMHGFMYFFPLRSFPFFATFSYAPCQ